MLRAHAIGLIIFMLFQGAMPAGAAAIPVAAQQIDIEWNFEQPTSVVTDLEGKMYVLDGANHRVVVFTKQGEKRFEFGKDGYGDGDLHLPMSLSIDKDRIVIADTGNFRLSLFDTNGNFIKNIEPDLDEASGIDEDLDTQRPRPVAVYLRNHILTWSDRANHLICQLELSNGSMEPACFGKRGEMEGEFQFPFQIASDQGDYLHITDVLNGRIQVFDKKGRYFSQVSRFGVNDNELFRPNGIALDDQDNLYVSDSYFGHISIFNSGRYLGKLRNSDDKPLIFQTPTGLHFSNGNLYIVETGNNRIHRITMAYKEIGDVQKPENSTRIEISQKNCVSCHLSWAKDAVTPPPLNPQNILPVSTEKMCYSCHHGVVMDSRLAIRHSDQHPTIYDVEDEKHSLEDMNNRKDKLPDELPFTKNKEMLCTTCHTPHNSDDQQQTLYSDNSNSWMRVSSRDGDLCERCHESKIKGARELDDKRHGINHPLAIKFEKPPTKGAKGYAIDAELHHGLPEELKKYSASLDSRKRLICQSCHQIHGGVSNELLAMDTTKGELCIQCHKPKHSNSKKDARRKGIHPVNVKLEKPIERKGEKITKVSCQSCHKVHTGSEGTPLLPNNARKPEDICVDCHKRHHAKDKDEALSKGIHPMNGKLDEPVNINGVKVKQMTCLTCHSIHGGKPGTPALIEKHQNGELCEHCHANKQAVVGSDHDLRITAKNKLNHFEELPADSGVCGSCHSMHRGKGKRPRFYAAEIVKTEPIGGESDQPLFDKDRLCLNCHQKNGIAKDKAIKHFSHPYKDMILRSNEKIMPLLAQDESVHEFGAIACITCHEPHTWKPSKPDEKLKPSKNRENLEGNSMNSFLRVKGVTDTFCVDCHSIEAMPKFKYYHDADLVRDLGVNYLE